MRSRASVTDINANWQFLSFFIITAAILMIPELVYAQVYQSSQSDVGNYICVIAENFEGNAGRGIATIGISTIGILALLGRIQWTQAIIIGVGCAILFGAPAILSVLGSNLAITNDPNHPWCNVVVA